MTHYAAINLRADINAGNRGFINTWEIAKFDTKAERDAFVAKNGNRAAKAVTRKEAEAIYADCFLSVGETVPVGGLFGNDTYGYGRFYVEEEA